VIINPPLHNEDDKTFVHFDDLSVTIIHAPKGLYQRRLRLWLHNFNLLLFFLPTPLLFNSEIIPCLTVFTRDVMQLTKNKYG
jgi:hypothetical protein